MLLPFSRSLVPALLLIFVLFFPADNARAEPDICRKIDVAGLAEDPQWLSLIHYERSGWNGTGWRSSIIDPAFFLAPDGSSSPQAELCATAAALVSADPGGDMHARCLFPARAEFLRPRLEHAGMSLAKVECEQFERWYEALNPGGISLIFPAAYLNNPASMFGHTLLRIEPRDRNENSALTAYAAHFAAETRGDGAVVYAFRGVFGGYNGYYSIAPYYERVTKYSDIEKRDIWEYELEATAAQAAQVARHLWELRRKAITYYYFDENCAYHLLTLFEVMRPDLALRPRFGSWVIPSETVHELLSIRGLVRERRFRPSLVARIRGAASELSAEERETVRALVRGERAAEDLAPDLRGALVLDLAGELAEYRWRRTSDPEEERELTARAHAIMAARAKNSNATEISPGDPPAPELGHRALRFSAGAGIERGSTQFGELTFKPALHGLIDPTDGYVNGAELDVFAPTVRWEEQKRFRLERYTVFQVYSLSSRDDLIEPTSWRLSVNAHRELIKKTERTLVASVAGGFGAAEELLPGTLAYLMGSVDLKHSAHLPEAAGVGFLPGLEFGSVSERGRVKLVTKFSAAHDILGSEDLHARLEGEAQFLLSNEIALGAKIARAFEYGGDYTTGTVQAHWYPR